jgi:acyl-CoA reductase-like NAD-dependent aldehyde dehydrogenase
MAEPIRRRSLDPVHVGLLIDGRWEEASARFEVTNPAHPTEVVGSLARGTAGDVRRAIAAAKGAQRQWATLSCAERANVLRQGLAKLDRRKDELATLYTLENGQTRNESMEEIVGTIRRHDYTLELAPQLDAERALDTRFGTTVVRWRPYGVVTSIVPWNGPFALALIHVMSALVTGNAIVVKPPETCGLALLQTLGLLNTVLPKGVLNAVTGTPEDIGDILTGHPDVAKVAFTGSVASATRIMCNAAKTIKSLALELGGNDPAIVLDDAELSDAHIQTMLRATLVKAGQMCMAIKRYYVHDRVYDEFIGKFRDALSKVVVGDGLSPTVTMGSMHTKKMQERGRHYATTAADGGATLETLGVIEDEATFDEGFFLQPVLVTDIAGDAPLVLEEQFSPVIPVLRFSDVEDALRQANATPFGLGGSVWGKDIERAQDIARRVESGLVWVNCHGAAYVDHHAPYGGNKQSGTGLRSGLEGYLAYLSCQTLSTAT